jgi:hypothetical protein
VCLLVTTYEFVFGVYNLLCVIFYNIRLWFISIILFLYDFYRDWCLFFMNSYKHEMLFLLLISIYYICKFLKMSNCCYSIGICLIQVYINVHAWLYYYKSSSFRICWFWFWFMLVYSNVIICGMNFLSEIKTIFVHKNINFAFKSKY